PPAGAAASATPPPRPPPAPPAPPAATTAPTSVHRPCSTPAPRAAPQCDSPVHARNAELLAPPVGPADPHPLHPLHFPHAQRNAHVAAAQVALPRAHAPDAPAAPRPDGHPRPDGVARKRRVHGADSQPVPPLARDVAEQPGRPRHLGHQEVDPPVVV